MTRTMMSVTCFVAKGSSPCPQSGVFPVLPSCSGYYGCYPVGDSLVSTGIVACTGSQVYDPSALACVDSISAPGEPTCGVSDIVVADTVECNAFYICSGGNILGEKICCGEGEVFNPDTSSCTTDSSGVTCPTDNPCYDGEVTKSCESDASTTAISSPITL